MLNIHLELYYHYLLLCSSFSWSVLNTHFGVSIASNCETLFLVKCDDDSVRMEIKSNTYFESSHFGQYRNVLGLVWLVVSRSN